MTSDEKSKLREALLGIRKQASLGKFINHAEHKYTSIEIKHNQFCVEIQKKAEEALQLLDQLGVTDK